MSIIYKINPVNPNYEDFCAILHESAELASVRFQMDFRQRYVTPEKMASLIESTNGVVFQAFDNETLVGGAVLVIANINKWYHSGEIGETWYLTVSPKYQHQGIAKHLKSMIYDYARQIGLPCLVASTNARNKASLSLSHSDGYIPVDTYISFRNQRSIKKIKWLDTPPRNVMYYWIRYRYKAIYTFLKMKRLNLQY